MADCNIITTVNKGRQAGPMTGLFLYMSMGWLNGPFPASLYSSLRAEQLTVEISYAPQRIGPSRARCNAVIVA